MDSMIASFSLFVVLNTGKLLFYSVYFCWTLNIIEEDYGGGGDLVCVSLDYLLFCFAVVGVFQCVYNCACTVTIKRLTQWR